LSGKWFSRCSIPPLTERLDTDACPPASLSGVRWGVERNPRFHGVRLSGHL
jgi:hypothetical protein